MSDLGRQLPGVLAGDDNLDRACVSIPPEACRETRSNLSRYIANGAASKLAEQIAGPNLILPWLFQVLGAPAWMFAFLMPIKQSFSLLPQMIVAGRIRSFPIRKWIWVSAGMVQTLCLLLMIPVSLWLSPSVAGICLLGLLLIFSTASGTASVAFQDVLGKTFAKGHRGKLLARRALVGGILTTAAGLLLNRVREQQNALTPILFMLLTAAILWGIAALCFASIKEFPGATDGGRNAVAETKAGLSLFRQHPGFRLFLQGRSLLLSVELATPFLVLHAAQTVGISTQGIGALVIAVGVSQIVSSPFWGQMADQTSRKVMALSALIAFAAIIIALSSNLAPTKDLQQSLYFAVFILIGLAESGARLGRKTYLVDAAPKQERATLTAFSNSAVGLLALISSLSGIIAQKAGSASMLLFLALVSLLAWLSCQRMPEAEQMLATENAVEL